MEHLPWVGSNYKRGIEGQRLAIVGYSHWYTEGQEDGVEATRRCISNIISREDNFSFFTAIRNYFSYVNHDAFWNDVMFFNYLPNCVGNSKRRYDRGSEDQISLAKTRLLRLLQQKLPQKVLIFTSRRGAFPETDEPLRKLSPEFPKFWQGAYKVGDGKIPVFFLRHPQGAWGDLMRRAVKHVLSWNEP